MPNSVTIPRTKNPIEKPLNRYFIAIGMIFCDVRLCLITISGLKQLGTSELTRGDNNKPAMLLLACYRD